MFAPLTWRLFSAITSVHMLCNMCMYMELANPKKKKLVLILISKLSGAHDHKQVSAHAQATNK